MLRRRAVTRLKVYLEASQGHSNSAAFTHSIKVQIFRRRRNAEWMEKGDRAQFRRRFTLASLRREPSRVGSRFPDMIPYRPWLTQGGSLHVTPARVRSRRRLCGDLAHLRSTVLRLAKRRHRRDVGDDAIHSARRAPRHSSNPCKA